MGRVENPHGISTFVNESRAMDSVSVRLGVLIEIVNVSNLLQSTALRKITTATTTNEVSNNFVCFLYALLLLSSLSLSLSFFVILTVVTTVAAERANRKLVH